MIDRLLTFPERRTGLVIVMLGLVFAAAYASSIVVRPKPHARVVVGDALHYYVQLRSAVFDGDLHFRNEYVRMYGLAGGEPGTEWVYQGTPTGHVRNLMPVGPAILWSPLFLLTAAGALVANAMGAAYPVDGYTRLFQATAGLSGVAAATAGVWFSWRACALLFPARAAAWACLSLWLASSALYYSLISPAYSHAASLFATSAFWYVWLLTRDSTVLKRYGALGVLAGAAALMRWQDGMLLATVAVDLILAVKAARLSIKQAAGAAAIAVAAAAITFAPQMAVWMTLYGQPLAIPQGPAFMRWTAPALGAVLFSDWHGLFTWTPIVVFCPFGLMLLWRRDRNLAAAAAVFLLLSWYVNAAVADWWAGEAFGSRRFVSCFPVFALGLAALIDRWAPSLRQLAVVSAALVVHALLLLVQYQAFMHGLRDIAPYPRGAYNMWVARFVVPFDLFRELLNR